MLIKISFSDEKIKKAWKMLKSSRIMIALAILASMNITLVFALNFRPPAAPNSAGECDSAILVDLYGTDGISTNTKGCILPSNQIVSCEIYIESGGCGNCVGT